LLIGGSECEGREEERERMEKVKERGKRRGSPMGFKVLGVANGR